MLRLMVLIAVWIILRPTDHLAQASHVLNRLRNNDFQPTRGPNLARESADGSFEQQSGSHGLFSNVLSKVKGIVKKPLGIVEKVEGIVTSPISSGNKVASAAVGATNKILGILAKLIKDVKEKNTKRKEIKPTEGDIRTESVSALGAATSGAVLAVERNLADTSVLSLASGLASSVGENLTKPDSDLENVTVTSGGAASVAEEVLKKPASVLKETTSKAGEAKPALGGILTNPFSALKQVTSAAGEAISDVGRLANKTQSGLKDLAAAAGIAPSLVEKTSMKPVSALTSKAADVVSELEKITAKSINVAKDITSTATKELTQLATLAKTQYKLWQLLKLSRLV